MNVDFLHDIYGNSLKENEKKILFWENYLQNLEALDLNIFAAKLTAPILVPVGSRIFFRGVLKHTNEVTVALGADYFTKCTVNQAEVLKNLRIQEAKFKLDELRREREYLQNQITISNQIYHESASDIIEFVTEEDNEIWQKQHRENVRKYKQKKSQDDAGPSNEMSNEELWNRLEELELQEELDNEIQYDEKDVSKPSTAEANDDTDSDDSENDNDTHDGEESINEELYDEVLRRIDRHSRYYYKRSVFQQPSKYRLFELVVERHNELKQKVAEMRARKRTYESEADMIDRVDEMERLERLEDEIAILEGMLGSDDDDDDIDEAEENSDNEQKKTVAFADDDDCETFELTFKHSKVEPSKEPYDPQKGITKPSDILKAYPGSFNGETTSILKKPKSNASPVSQTKPVTEEKQDKEKEGGNQDSNLNGTIVVRDVVERVDSNENNVNQNERPMSLFKKRRQQLKE